MNKLIKKIIAAVLAASFIIATPAVSADAMTVKQVNSTIKKVKKRISKNKKAYKNALAEDNKTNAKYSKMTSAFLYCTDPFIVYDNKLSKYLEFDDPSAITSGEVTGQLYSGIVYVSNETIRFNGNEVYKAKIVEYSHKAADVQNKINSDTEYLNRLKNSKKELVAIDSTTLQVGESQQLVTHFTYGTEGINTLKWKSSAPKIVSVSKTGVVTGKKKGSAVISAKLSVTGKTYTTVVTVE